LRSSRSAGAVYESVLRAHARFLRQFVAPGHVAWHRGYGHGLARQCRGTFDGIADLAAVRAGGGRAELPDSYARTGADLGRPGAANDPERGDPALVERHAYATALGGTKHGLCRIRAGAVGFERSPTPPGGGGAGSLHTAIALEESRAVPGRGRSAPRR